MKILGHPVHMMLVHFPTALLPMDAVCSVIHYFTKNISFIHASFYAMSGGVLLGWTAIAFGVFDLISLSETRADVVKKALIHGSINTSVIVVYTVLVYSQYKNYPQLLPDSLAVFVLKIICVLILIVGNFLGGSLILKHKVAVEK